MAILMTALKHAIMDAHASLLPTDGGQVLEDINRKEVEGS
jgi:hypothetical protein